MSGHRPDPNEFTDDQLVDCWHAAARDPAVARAVKGVYDDTASRVEQRGPACWASGRCCHFEATGHRLYVTGLEAAIAQQLAARPAVTSSVRASLTLGGCPFQQGHLCGEREARPLGCRVYFCDQSAQSWQQELSEHGINQIRVIHDEFDIPYRYAEWRSLLMMLSHS